MGTLWAILWPLLWSAVLLVVAWTVTWAVASLWCLWHDRRQARLRDPAAGSPPDGG